MKTKDILFWIFFPIISLLITGLLVFYLDLANGPLFFFILEIIVLVAAITMRIILRHKRFVIRMIPLLSVIIVNIILLPLAQPSVERKRATFHSDFEKTEVLTLKNGKIQGAYNKDKSVRIYAGVPYAKPPVDDLRWKEPQELDNWEGVKDCTYFAPRSMQVDQNAVISSLVDMYAEGGWHPDYHMHPLQDMSEDSLYLNIWRPNTNETNLPILMFIHGGSLTGGSSAYVDYNGEAMAKKGVIMITIQYRLGVFGYFAHEELEKESANNTTGN